MAQLTNEATQKAIKSDPPPGSPPYVVNSNWVPKYVFEFDEKSHYDLAFETLTSEIGTNNIVFGYNKNYR